MKTTSFDISKKLAEIGFKAKSIFGWHVDGKECGPAYPLSPTATGFFWAYDLETILEALPMGLDMFDGRFVLVMDQRSFLAYANFDKGSEILQTVKRQDESLADCAARLLIILHEKGLIKFEVENDE